MTSKHEIAFILYGPLRGGTTLLRLMLNHHPDLANAGEFDYIFDYMQRTPEGIRIDRDALSRYFLFQDFGFIVPDGLDDAALLDALLAQITARKPGIQSINIHRDIGHVLELLPDTKVVKLHRDPRDVALSSIPLGWAGTGYHGVKHWIETERAWDRAKAILPPDRRLELSYEDLVSHPERELTRICHFVGVDYDPAMLTYPDHSTYGPVDASYACKWKGKLSTAEAALITSRAPELIASRGYEVPPGSTPPGLLKQLAIAFEDKRGVWRHDVARFGLGVTCQEKLTRWLGLRALHNRVMEDKVIPVYKTIVK